MSLQVISPADLAATPAPPHPGQGLPVPLRASEVAPADLAAAQKGDTAAFARLVRAHQGRVFSVALRLTGSREDAEELAQDAFVQLHAALAQVQGPQHLLHWLLRTVTHRGIDRLRARERAPRLVQIEAGNEPAGHDAAGDPLWKNACAPCCCSCPTRRAPWSRCVSRKTWNPPRSPRSSTCR